MPNFIRASLATVRALLRPMNNTLIKRFKNIDPNRPSHAFFLKFGFLAQWYEARLDKLILGSKCQTEFKQLQPGEAFEKGVEWFTEVVFFYGLLFLITWYELDRHEKAKNLSIEAISRLVNECEGQK